MALLRRLFAAAVAAGIAQSQPAFGQRQFLNVPAGPLGRSAALLGRQAHVSIGITEPGIARLPVQRVAGNLTVQQGLAALIRGLPVRVIVVDATTYLIAATPHRVTGMVTPRRRVPPPTTPTTSDVPEVTEILVTGTKLPATLGSYPGQVVRVSSREVDGTKGLGGSEALVAATPIVTSTYLGAGRNKLFLRGIADSSFSGPTQATVAQYFGEARINYTAPDPDLRLYDIDQIELLPGPQATLFGAGTLGGVIRIAPKAPSVDRTSGRLSIGGSHTVHGALGWDAAGVLNVPLATGTIGMRMVIYRADDGGYIDDVRRAISDVNSVHVVGGRAAARAFLSSDWVLDLNGVTQRIDGDDAQYSTIPENPLTTSSSVRQNYWNAYSLVGASLRRLSGPARLVVSAAASSQTFEERFDATMEKVPAVFDQRTNVRLHSFEARASSAPFAPIGWVAGVSAADNRFFQQRRHGLPGQTISQPGLRNSLIEVAVFGEAAMPVFGGTTLTAGLRLAHTRLDGRAIDVQTSGPTESTAETFALPSLALSGSPIPNLIVYGRYQQGFRPAGFGIYGDIVERFQSDHMAAFEAGARFRPRGDMPFSAEGSLTYTRWNDIQADTLDFAGLPTTMNIGDGEIYTASMQFAWSPMTAVKIEAAGLFNHSLVTNPTPGIIIVEHSPLPNVARANARIGARYTMHPGRSMDLEISGSGHFVGKSRLGAGPILGRDQGGWFDVDLGADLAHGNQHFTLAITNLLNAVTNRFAFGSPFTLVAGEQVTPLRPRSVRLGWDVRF